MKNIAFIFPGQGSQTIGMGKDFYENSQTAKELFESASERISYDMTKLLFEENSDLEKTKYTQPAILLVSMIANKLFQNEANLTPSFALGHSLGEFSALSSVGAIDIVDAVELVHKRGEFMQSACEGTEAGMMALIGLKDDVVEELCANAQNNGKKIWPANYNSDGQIVLAGIKPDLAAMESTFKDAGAKRALLLNMSVASHCPLLEDARGSLEDYLSKSVKDDFLAPVISNVTAEKYNSKDEALKLLSEQLVKPVRYKQSIEKFADSVDMMIEFGNGSVLKGLNRRATKTPTLNVNSMETLEKVLKEI